MRRYHALVTIVWTLLVLPAFAGDRPVVPCLQRGFLINGACYTMTLADSKGESHLLYASVMEGKNNRTIGFRGPNSLPSRFRLQFDQLWEVIPYFAGDYVGVINLPALLKAKMVSGPRDKSHGGVFVGAGGEGTIQGIMHVEAHIKINKHYDYLPLSKDSARLFLLVDYPWTALPDPVNGPWAKAVGQVLNGQKLNRKWRFTTAKYQGIWRAERGGWLRGVWSDPEDLEIPFTEAFHVYGLGEDYYFVTETGKVYVSPPLKAGETGIRKVTPFWSDPQQPITHLVTDVDGPAPDLTYAFGSSSRPDGAKKQERFYIKLQGQHASPSYFRVGQLKPAPDLDEPLKTLLEYSRLIRFGPEVDNAADQEITRASKQNATRLSWWWYLIGVCLALVLGAAVYYYRRSRIARG